MLGLRWLSIAWICLGACASQPLELRRVVLYQNGVGYFEHTGKVSDDRLRFFVKPYEVDDILKTLTVVSKGASLAATVHTTRVDAVSGGQLNAGGEPHSDKRTAIDVSLAHVRGQRVSVSYAVPTPTWKATYRVVLPERGGSEALLQGWAALQNTSDEDWKDVELTLATGAPFSYAIDLHSPEFAARPDLSGQLVKPAVTAAVESSRALPGDADSDGILDAQDLCSSEPEDVDGFEDEDGCPDPDNDKDRILDVDDQCPSDSETYNGLEDEDGCPDRGRVVVQDSSLEILDKIYFEKGSAVIRAVSMPLVEAIAATLIGNPTIRLVEVQGHAADDEAQGNRLALERSDAVVAALLQRGVALGRLQSRSYGATNPVDSGKSADSRAKNRRVEFLVLQRDDGSQSAASENRPQLRASLEGAGASAAPVAQEIAGAAQYRLPARISIPKGESTLVPIVNRQVAGSAIYLFRPDGGAPGSDRYPFRAARVANATGVSLPAGPVAVFADGSFAGEGLMQPLFADEVAYIPYAIDRSTVVTHDQAWDRKPSRILAIHDGTVRVEDLSLRHTRYRVKAGRHAPASVYLHHPRMAGYDLFEPASGTEESPGAALVPVPLRPNQEAVMEVTEVRPEVGFIDLRSALDQTLGEYAQKTELPAEVHKRLQAVITVRRQLFEAQREAEELAKKRYAILGRANEVRASLTAIGKSAAELRRKLLADLSSLDRDSEKLLVETTTKNEEAARLRVQLLEQVRELHYGAANDQ